MKTTTQNLSLVWSLLLLASSCNLFSPVQAGSTFRLFGKDEEDTAEDALRIPSIKPYGNSYKGDSSSSYYLSPSSKLRGVSAKERELAELQSSSLRLDEEFVTAVNMSYAFPMAPNPDIAVGIDMAISVNQFSIEGIDKLSGNSTFTNSLRWLWRTQTNLTQKSVLPGFDSYNDTYREEVNSTALPKNFYLEHPRILYDNDKDRFLMLSVLTDKVDFMYSKLLLAFSKTGSPSTGLEEDWDRVIIEVSDLQEELGEALWATLPTIAVDNNTIYITADMMYREEENPDIITGVNQVDKFVESRLWTLDKELVYATGLRDVINTDMVDEVDGSLMSTSLEFDLQVHRMVYENELGVEVMKGQWIPSHMDAEEEFGMYFVHYHGEDVEEDDTEQLSVLFYSKVTGELSDALIDLGDVEDRSLPFYNATQPRDIELDRALLWDELIYSDIFTGTRRAQDAVWWNETLYVAVTVSKTIRVNETQVYWVALTAPSTNETTGDLLEFIDDEMIEVVKDGYVTGDAIEKTIVDPENGQVSIVPAFNSSTFFPSIAVNNKGEIVIGFSAAGEELYMGSYTQEVGVPYSIPDLNITEKAITIAQGDAAYESINGIPYAGDYSGMVVDPIEPNCFWSFNSYAMSLDAVELHSWERGALATRWGKVCL